MRNLLVIVSLLLLAGCNEAQMQKADDTPWVQENLGYVKDRRTNLCFSLLSYSRMSSSGSESYGMNLSNVPCTPEVEFQISQRKVK